MNKHKSIIHIALFAIAAFSAVSVLLCQNENIRILREEFNRNPQNYAIAFNLGVEYFRNGLYESAERMFDKSQKLASNKHDKAKALYNSACAEYKQGKTDEAKSNLKASLTLNPNDSNAKYNYSLLSVKYSGAKAQENTQNQKNKKSNNQNDNNKDKSNEIKSGIPETNRGIKDSESILNAVKNRELQLIKEMKNKKVKKTSYLRDKTW